MAQILLNVIHFHLFTQNLQSIDKIGPNRETLAVVQRRIVKGELNPRFEGFIEYADSIAGKDQDAFQNSSALISSLRDGGRLPS